MLLSQMKRLVSCSNPSVSEDRHNVNGRLMLITDKYFYDTRQRSFAPPVMNGSKFFTCFYQAPSTDSVVSSLYSWLIYDFLTSVIYTLTFTVSSPLPTPYVFLYFGLFLIRRALNLKFPFRFHLKTVIRRNYVYSEFSECCWMEMTLMVFWNVIKVKKTLKCTLMVMLGLNDSQKSHLQL